MASQQKLRLLDSCNSCLNLTVHGKETGQVTHKKLLGVQIDRSLTWDQQVNKVQKTFLFKQYNLRKVNKYLPVEIKTVFYNYYIRPHLDYCSSLWSHTSQKNHSKLIKLQKQAARLVFNKVLGRKCIIFSSDMFRDFQWRTSQIISPINKP